MILGAHLPTSKGFEAALQRALELNPEASFIHYVSGGQDLLEGKPEAALARGAPLG